MPQSQVEHGQLRKFHDALQSVGGDLGASVEVDAAQVAQMFGHGLICIWVSWRSFVCDS